ncbi:uncharacterized protein LOC125652159 isoform X1 [Ostrea edulis]|uniref:uncharacterized protein LOC125652159 isoform X1 n=1 Tax=Ostrea edulis TaxID=37623 RepID=UPI0024AED55C|nr:uncharacterized protein LOC125652159 isoform X1 [Ostrea edulis]
MVFTKNYLIFSFVILFLEGFDASTKTKHTSCRRMLDHILEETEMECHDNDVIYVERQLITSENVKDLRVVEKPCNGTSRSEICTQSLPLSGLDSHDSDRSQFIVGVTCNLKKRCVLDKTALNKSFDAFHGTCQETNLTREFIATSFTYRCVPREKFIHLGKNESTLIITDVHLITEDLGGNFSCEINGTVRRLSLLELSLTRLVIYRDDETIYNNTRDVYGVDITLRNSSSNNKWYNLDISTERIGRTWIHLKGNFQISCKSTFLAAYTGTTVDALTNFPTDTRHPQGSTSKTSLLLLLIIGLVMTLVLMVGLYTLHRRKDQKKLAELTKQTDTVSINFNHHVIETPVNNEEEAGRNIYSEISSTRRDTLSFGNDIQI